MKKIGIVLLSFMFSINIFSQIKKGNLLVSIDGNYIKKNSANGVTTNQNSTNGKYLDLGFSAGHFISDRFVFGVGLDYNREKEIRLHRIYHINIYGQQEQMTVKSNVFMPNAYCAYYYPITNRLYVSSKLKFSYGKLKTSFNSLIGSKSVWGYYTDPIDPGYNSFMRVDYESENEYSVVGIYPELNYFVSKKYSLNIGLGGIEYATLDWKNDNSNLVVNFNPAYWKVGVKLFLN